MKKNKTKNQDLNERLWEVIPLMVILFLVPIIVYIKTITLTGYVYENWTGQRDIADFFSYYKSRVLLFSVGIVLAIYFAKFYREGSKAVKSVLFSVPLIIYGLFIFLSTIYSKYGDVALFGITDRNEGMLVLISYCILCFYTFNVLNTTKKAKYLIHALLAGTFVISFIGIFQYLGLDFFKSDFGKKLILGDYYESLKSQVSFNVSNNAIYSTLYHFDYVASFTAILVPLLLVLTIFTKELKHRLLYAGMLLITALTWLGCTARSGWLGVVTALIIFGILFYKKMYQHKKVSLMAVAGILAVITFAGIFAQGAIKYRINNTIWDITNLINNFGKQVNKDNLNLPLRDLKLTENEVNIVTKWEGLKVHLDKEFAISFSDGNNKDIPYTLDQNGGKITLQNSAYKDYDMFAGKLDKSVMLIIKRTGGVELYFKLDNDKIKLANRQGKELQLGPVEKWGFEGAETFASNRGYIWSRTIPLLRNTLLLGYGPDTFVFYFPQVDFYDRLRLYDDMWHLVDKPHNLYLQIAFSTGIPSLIVLIIMFLIYFVMSISLYFNCDMTKEENIYGVGCFLGVCAYLVAGLFNDSIVGVASIFWIVLGMGIAMNIIANKCRTN